MGRAREAAERTARLAEHHIVEQEGRIERQVSLIAELERDGHIAMLKEAQRLLSEMIVLLVKMHDDLQQAYRTSGCHLTDQRSRSRRLLWTRSNSASVT
jgi:hypothetical protein